MSPIVRVLAFEVASKGILGVTVLLLVRHLTPDNYATYTLATALASVICQAFSSSLNSVYLACSRDFRDRRREFLGAQIYGALLVAGVVLPFLPWARPLLPYIAALILGTTVSNFTKVFFQSELRFGMFSAVEVSRSIVFLAGVTVLVWISPAPSDAAVLSVQSASLMLTLIALKGTGVWRAFLPAVRRYYGIAREVVGGEMVWLFLYFVVLATESQAEIFLLRSISDTHSLATFGAAYRYYALVMLAISPVQLVLVPMIHRSSDSEVGTVFRDHRVLVWILGPVIALGALASPWVIPWIDLGKYPTSIPTFQILAVSAIVSLVLTPYAGVLQRRRDFKGLFTIAIATFVLQLVGTSLLVWQFDEIGAALGTLFTYLFQNGSIALRARRGTVSRGEASALSRGNT